MTWNASENKPQLIVVVVVVRVFLVRVPPFYGETTQFYGRRCVTLRIFILGLCVTLYALKIGNLMKAAYSTSCFSDNSDYCRACVKWKQLK